MKQRILVIDDEEDYQHLMQLILEPEGFEVITAGDGETGYQKLKEMRPDMVILDVNLPKASGYEICQKIRDEKEIGYVPVVMLTVRSKDEEQAWGLNLGCDDYITKPFEPGVLLARIKAVLRRAQNYKEKT